MIVLGLRFLLLFIVTDALIPILPKFSISIRNRLKMTSEICDCNSVTMKGTQKSVSATAFREMILTDLNSDPKKLGDIMGNDKSVVVFLRHLG